MRDAVLQAIEREKLIAIIRSVPQPQLLPLVEALYAGGIRLLEITYSADGKVSDEQTAQIIAQLAQHWGSDLHVGAGTVLTTKQVELTGQAGGSFVLSPDTNVQVIHKTGELGLVSIPGALTPTELQTAHAAGADFVKLFPAGAMGPAYVKAVRAPLPHIKLLGVGGIDEKNMTDYWKAGCCGFGIGTNIIRKDLLAAGDYAGITALAKQYKAVTEQWQTT